MCNSKPPSSPVAGHTVWPFTRRDAGPEVCIWVLFSSSNPTLFNENQRIPERSLNSLSIALEGFKSKVFRSNFVEFCNNQYSYHLVKWTTDAQTPLIWTPVQTWNGLGRQCDILQKADRTCNSHLYTLGIFLWPLNWVFAENKIKVVRGDKS